MMATQGSLLENDPEHFPCINLAYIESNSAQNRNSTQQIASFDPTDQF